MPTGYTAPVADGEFTTLREFALECALAFGATNDMSDAPADEPIPGAFTPLSYHQKQAASAQRRIAKLRAMSPIDAQRACQQEYAQAVARWKSFGIEDAQKRVRYLDMIRQLERWNAPTPDHTNLRDFMLEQLRTSLKFDCGGGYNPLPRLKRWPEWLADAIARAKKDHDYHLEHHYAAVERATEMTYWVRDLRASLADLYDDL